MLFAYSSATLQRNKPVSKNLYVIIFKLSFFIVCLIIPVPRGAVSRTMKEREKKKEAFI